MTTSSGCGTTPWKRRTNNNTSKKRKVSDTINEMMTTTLSLPHGPNLRKQTHAGIMEMNPTQLLPAAPVCTERQFRMASDMEMSLGCTEQRHGKGKERKVRHGTIGRK